jgi:aminocarboxymuconate-semialdehyde decarboxylase
VPLVDVHAHYVPALCFADPAYGFSVSSSTGSGTLLMRGGVPLGPAEETIEQLSDIDRRLVDMDAGGVDIQAISVDPGLFFYDLGIDEAIGRAEVLNEAIAGVVGAHPDRFVGFGTISLQDIDVAIGQLERCMTTLGMRGVEICTNVNGRYLHEAEFAPFLEAADSLGATIFFHPYNIAGGDRTTCFAGRVVIGNPFETSIALYGLVLGGVVERHPALRMIFSHGGGALPYLAGRIERGYALRSEIRGTLSAPPATYFPQVFFDTIVHDPRALRFLVEMWGAACVVPGTDYPYDMGDPAPRRVVEAAFGADAAESKAILERNGASSLGLSVSAGSSVDR